MKVNKHTIVALVQDRPGVLNRAVSLFRRRGFNIESLAVGHSETPGISRMTLVVEAEADETVVGLNLDGRVDDEPAIESCMKLDFTAPDGTPGIDNQLSLFGPILGL